MHNIAIKIENLSKIYKLYDKPIDRLKETIHPFRKKYHKDFYALNDVSFEINKGEAVGIIGKNGSGKSTLLKIISGVLTPTAGNLTVDGKVSALLELGTGFNPEFTGIQNIFLNGTIMGYSREEINAKLNDIINFADIGEFITQPVKIYSSGMFARLAFAVAINVDPDILIVDEALSVGDVAFQIKCFRKFADFKELGKTILFVSHSLDSILKYCDKAIVLDSGIKISDGSSKEMIDVYKKLLVNCYYDSDESIDEKVNDDIHKYLGNWKNAYESSADILEYGTKSAEIFDYGIFDERDRPSINFFCENTLKIKMKVRFNCTVKEPIFAFTIKDIKGNELAGTNSMYENISTGVYNTGKEAVVTFTQKINLAGGAYTVSFGCTNFVGEDFLVLHRLYDAIVFHVQSIKRMVGVYYLNSTIDIE